MMDNMMGGLAFLVNDFNPAATAFLNVSFKKPIIVDRTYAMIGEVEKIEGKKMFINAKIVDEENNVCAEAKSLFIKVDWNNMYLLKMKETISNKIGDNLNTEKALHYAQ